MTTNTMKQNDLVLGHLKRYGTITNLDAQAMYGITRLAARVHDLRTLYGDGAIKMERVKFVHWFTGRNGTYARYTAARELKLGVGR